MTQRERHNANMKRYRGQAGKHRLELMISPELKQRFADLPGLEKATHAQRLAALCSFWESTHAKSSKTQAMTNPTSVAGSSLESRDVQAPPAAASSTALKQSMPEYTEKELPVTQAVIPKNLSWRDKALPKVPPFPDQAYADKFNLALERFYEREWPRHKHGNSADAKIWTHLLRTEPELLQAFRMLTDHRELLGQLIRHCCVPISPNDILAWSQLDAPDRERILWYLIHAGTIHSEVLGQAGKNFAKALKQQPKRDWSNWVRQDRQTL